MVSTVIACMTPPGKAAVATLGVRGPLAWPITHGFFQPRRGALPEAPGEGTFWLGELGAELRDDVIVAVKQITPTVFLELHCHGGPAVVRLIEELYAQRGVQVCTWQEFQRGTNASAWHADAEAWLVKAPTERTAAILLDQYDGAFHRSATAARAALADGRLEAAAESVRRLARQAGLGRHLVRPWSVVIAGAPNVGKSSLVNALTGYTRSVVAATSGTTRDVTTTTLAIDGWPVELSDTAGLRDAASAIEAEGIDRARAAVAKADLCLWVLDGAAADAGRVDFSGSSVQVVINKADLAPAWDWSRFPEAPRVSATSRTGLRELCDAISRWLVPDPPARGAAVPYSPDLCDRMEAADRWLSANRTAADNELEAAIFSLPCSENAR